MISSKGDIIRMHGIVIARSRVLFINGIIFLVGGIKSILPDVVG
jgi:hypothetical protein